MDDVRFSVLTTFEDDALVVRYGVDNLSSRTLYLLNRVHDHALEPRQELAYVALDSEHRTVHIYKDTPPIPDGRSPTMPYVPYVTPVRGHKRFGESIRVALPVHEQLAYDPVRTSGDRETFTRLKVTIGYYWSVDGMQEPEEKTAAGTPYIAPVPPPRTKLQFGKLEHEEELDMPVVVPVRRRH